MQEVWKDIKGYEGLYQISNFGRVKSFKKNKNGKIKSTINDKGSYLSVGLCGGERKQYNPRIHRLVAEHFIGDIPKGYEVHHIDGNKQNNRVDNLKIVTKQEHAAYTCNLNPNIYSKIVHRNKYEIQRKVEQYTLFGEYVATYVNASVAGQYTGTNPRDILYVANKTPFNDKGDYRLQSNGFIWIFEGDTKPNVIKNTKF